MDIFLSVIALISAIWRLVSYQWTFYAISNKHLMKFTSPSKASPEKILLEKIEEVNYNDMGILGRFNTNEIRIYNGETDSDNDKIYFEIEGLKEGKEIADVLSKRMDNSNPINLSKQSLFLT